MSEIVWVEMYLPSKKHFHTETYTIKNIVTKNNQKISKKIPLQKEEKN